MKTATKSATKSTTRKTTAKSATATKAAAAKAATATKSASGKAKAKSDAQEVQRGKAAQVVKAPPTHTVPLVIAKRGGEPSSGPVPKRQRQYH